MRIMLINPTKKVLKSLITLGHQYEVVKSPADMESRFRGRNGIFDGIIAPIDATANVLAEIGRNWHVRQRELPILLRVRKSKVASRPPITHPRVTVAELHQPLTETILHWLSTHC
jgi:hypothetical protein